MNIRKAIPQDKEQLKQLLAGFYIEDKHRFSSKLQRWEAYKNQDDVIETTINDYLSNPKYIVYAAEENEKLMGYICGEVKEKKHKVSDKEGYIQDWFVDKTYRDQKVGKELFDTLTNQFKDLKCTHIALDSFVENQKAIDIYHQMGFEDRLLVLRKDL